MLNVLKLMGWSLILLLLTLPHSLFSQACCSGGVPISSNLGLGASTAGTFQFQLTYDHNTLKDLLASSERLDDDRNRAAEFQAWINLVLSTYGNIAALWQPGGPFYNQGIPQNPGANYSGGMPDYSQVTGPRLRGRTCRFLPRNSVI